MNQTRKVWHTEVITPQVEQVIDKLSGQNLARVLFPLESFREIQVADVRDIASMKISAIASRGTRRDFIDLYVVCRSYGLDLLLDLFGRKFAQVEYNRIHVLKSLAYFEDAEKEPMPDMLSDISWQQVRNFLSREVKRLIPQ